MSDARLREPQEYAQAIADIPFPDPPREWPVEAVEYVAVVFAERRNLAVALLDARARHAEEVRTLTAERDEARDSRDDMGRHSAFLVEKRKNRALRAQVAKLEAALRGIVACSDDDDAVYEARRALSDPRCPKCGSSAEWVDCPSHDGSG